MLILKLLKNWMHFRKFLNHTLIRLQSEELVSFVLYSSTAFVKSYITLYF